MNTKLLKLLNRDSHTSVKDLAVMLGSTEEAVRAEIEEMERTLEGAALNSAKERLAYELTTLIHGKEEADKCLQAAHALFGGSGASEDMPTTEIPAAEIGEGINILDLLVRCSLAPSKSEARRLVTQGGIAVDDNKVTNPSALVPISDSIIIKKGKKVYHKVSVQ